MKIDYNRPICCTIAGFDPTGGAGILADIKVFQQNRIIGFGVASSQTVQTENTFLDIKWNSFEFIIEQLNPLLENYSITYFKIGLIESLDCLVRLLAYIHEKVEHPIIIWDPIINSTSGFNFHSNLSKEKLTSILSKVYLVTPNVEEIKLMDTTIATSDGIVKSWISLYTNLFCKSYLEDSEYNIYDVLIYKSKEGQSLSEPYKKEKLGFSKHGTGCMMSSFILSELSKGINLTRSIANAQLFMTKILSSNHNRLAYID